MPRGHAQAIAHPDLSTASRSVDASTARVERPASTDDLAGLRRQRLASAQRARRERTGVPSASDITSARTPEIDRTVVAEPAREVDAVLNGVRDELRRVVGDERFARYFMNGRALHWEPAQRVATETAASADAPTLGPSLVVRVPSHFIASLIDRHFRAELERLARLHGLSMLARVRFEISGQLHAQTDDASATTDALGPRLVGAPEAPAIHVDAANAGTPRANTRTDTRVDPRSAHRSGARQSQRPNLRLEDFIIGGCNRLAYAAATSLVEHDLDPNLRLNLSGPSASALQAANLGAATLVPAPSGAGSARGHRVVYIYGPCGTGKSHLLQATTRAVGSARAHGAPNAGAPRTGRDPRSGLTARCVSGAQFADEFIQSVRLKRVDTFRRTYRHLDLLCIDDVQGLEGKTATQVELQHTLDAITARGGRVLASGPAHPRGLARLSDAVRSRLVAGMVAEIATPDRATAERMVGAMARRRGMVLDAPGASAIVAGSMGDASAPRSEAAGATGTAGGTIASVGTSASTGAGLSVRDLEGALTRVEACHRLLGPIGGDSSSARVGLLTIDRALRANVATPRSERRAVRVEQIVAEVCSQLGVAHADLGGSGRHPRVVLARALVSYLGRRLTTRSCADIALALGRPNHSTIITACNRLRAQLEQDAVVRLSPGDAHAGGLMGGGEVRLRELVDRLVERLDGRAHAGEAGQVGAAAR